MVHIKDAAYEQFSSILYPWASSIVFAQCEKEISMLSNEYHISTEKLTYGELKSIHLDMLAITYETKAPSVWNLLGILPDMRGSKPSDQCQAGPYLLYVHSLSVLQSKDPFEVCHYGQGKCC